MTLTVLDPCTGARVTLMIPTSSPGAAPSHAVSPLRPHPAGFTRRSRPLERSVSR